jgi:hypothetical protein
MSVPPELVTIFRSMDENAEDDSEAIRDVLAGQGISVEVLDDSAPGVPEGTYEVRVAPADAVRAERVVAEYSRKDDDQIGDNSDALDLEMVFQAGSGTSAEMEAMNVKNLLESNGIDAVLVGDSVIPSFPFEVRVARDQAALARQVIEEAQQAENS